MADKNTQTYAQIQAAAKAAKAAKAAALLAQFPDAHKALADMPALPLVIAGVQTATVPTVFSTGSRGYRIPGIAGKVTLPDGTRLQITFNAVVIGSKPGA